MKTSKNKKEYLQDIVNQFVKEHNPKSFEMADVAKWAISKGLWNEPPESKIKRCAQQLSDAAGEEYRTDNKGRRVRAKANFRVSTKRPDGTTKQTWLWADLRDLTPKQARLSFGQRKKQIEGECTQLNTDVASYNDENSNNDHYQLSLDFTYVAEYADQSDEYKPD